jgi:hypothetical protein
MDLSKLPRLSTTGSPPPADPAAPEAPPPELLTTTSAPAAGYCTCGAPLRAGARFCDSCGAPVAVTAPDQRALYAGGDAGIGAEVWLSAIIGAFLMLLGRSFGGWLVAKATGHAYNTGLIWGPGPHEGEPVAYWEQAGYAALNDSAIFLFGLAMVLEAVVLALIHTRFRHKAGLVTFALLIALTATAYNLFAAIKLLTVDVTPLWSLLAVAFGGYIAIFEWRLLQQLRSLREQRAVIR